MPPLLFGRDGGPPSFAFALARTYAGGLLLEHADWLLRQENDTRGAAAARRWCAGELAPLPEADGDHRAASRALALEG